MSRVGYPLFVLAAIVIIIAGLKAGASVLTPVLFALVIVILIAPFVRYLERLRLPSWLALTLTIVGLLIIGSGLVTILYGSLNQLVRHIPEYQRMLMAQIDPIIALLDERGFPVLASISQIIPTGSSLARTVIDLAIDLLSNVFGIVFFLALVVFMLADSRQFGRRLQAAAPNNPVIARLDSFTGQIQRQYAIQAGSNLVSASAITIMLLAFGVDYAFLWGVLVFFLAFVPNVGLTIAVAPACFLAFIQFGPIVALAVILGTVAINLVMDNAVTPRFLGAGLNVPVLVVFVSLFFWTWVFGLLGALLAVPATLFLRLILDSNERTRSIALLLSGDPEEEMTKSPTDPPVPAQAA